MTNPSETPPGHNQGDSGRQDEKKKPRGMGGVFIIFLLLFLLFVMITRGDPGTKSVYRFWHAALSKEFKRVVVEQDLITGYLNKGADKIEIVSREFTPAEMADLERLQSVDLAEGIYAKSDAIESFLADIKNGEVVIDKLWIVHLTTPRAGTPPPRGDMKDTGPRDYVTALITKNGAIRYIKVPIRGTELEAFQQLRKLVKDEKIPFDTKTLSLANTYEVKKVDTLTYFLLGTIMPWVLIIGLFWFFIIRQMRSPGGSGGVLSFGRSRAARYTKERRTHVTFADVEGISEAKDEVREIIEFLKNRQKFQRLGGRIPRGVLLVGSPGTGKTLLAKAIAGEADVPFFSISGSDFVEMFVGVGASRVRDLFKQARESSPCIVFLDEIDAVGRKRGSGHGGGHDEREQTLNAILVEMDGFDTDEGIILIGATNRPDVLDPALLRPGRFDRQVVIDMPDVNGRIGILKVHSKNIRTVPDIDFERLARATPGFSGAELAALINEAAILAVMKGDDAVDIQHLEEARDRVRWGREKRSRKILEDDRRVTAYHEAGHALVGARIPEVDPVHKVTIISRGMALGATMYLPEKEDYHMRRSKMQGLIAMSYGGRIAEDLVFGDVSAGAQNDIREATRIARLMVTQWGMSDKVGPLNYSASPEQSFLGADFIAGREHSDETARLIDEEVKRIVEEGYTRAKEILTADRAILEQIAEALMMYETISGEEVRDIVGGTSPEELRPAPGAGKAGETSAATETVKKPKESPDEDLGLSGAEGLVTS